MELRYICNLFLSFLHVVLSPQDIPLVRTDFLCLQMVAIDDAFIIIWLHLAYLFVLELLIYFCLSYVVFVRL